jgi:hypothetical protein
MDFVAIVDQVIALLRQRGRVAYRTLKVQFSLDDDALEALKDELLYAHQVARDEDERILVWTGDAQTPPSPPPLSVPPASPSAAPAAARPQTLSPSAPEAERRQLTVLFCDLVPRFRNNVMVFGPVLLPQWEALRWSLRSLSPKDVSLAWSPPELPP